MVYNLFIKTILTTILSHFIWIKAVEHDPNALLVWCLTQFLNSSWSIVFKHPWITNNFKVLNTHYIHSFNISLFLSILHDCTYYIYHIILYIFLFQCIIEVFDCLLNMFILQMDNDRYNEGKIHDPSRLTLIGYLHPVSSCFPWNPELNY
jgi:hypothetical protein